MVASVFESQFSPVLVYAKGAEVLIECVPRQPMTLRRVLMLPGPLCRKKGGCKLMSAFTRRRTKFTYSESRCVISHWLCH
jgi:hypothetical protein